ncbi:hypothetical protein SB6413_00914 [Klebsiella pasteurii]|uniref:hypothetical protein n=1 Tax=Klebsiella pasteurii TaxID=2587529 RepID=UPI00115DBA39|nr:hypothetical protein [Klebsiella pasteurii]VUS98026.1 hypothetical protein SB6413_00914 [Klebsiella pasteurii]
MTKSTITREQAEDTIEGLQELISRGLQSVYLDMALAGMRQLLAAMDQKPVIVVGDDGGDALSYRRLIQSFAPGTKLYRHAQQPVVPEEMTAGIAVKHWQGGRGSIESFVAGCNFFRAAMLNGGKL